MSNAVEVVETAAVEVEAVETEMVAKGKPGRPVTHRGVIGRELKRKQGLLKGINLIIDNSDDEDIDKLNEVYPADYIDELTNEVANLQKQFDETPKNPKRLKKD